MARLAVFGVGIACASHAAAQNVVRIAPTEKKPGAEKPAPDSSAAPAPSGSAPSGTAPSDTSPPTPGAVAQDSAAPSTGTDAGPGAPNPPGDAPGGASTERDVGPVGETRDRESGDAGAVDEARPREEPEAALRLAPPAEKSAAAEEEVDPNTLPFTHHTEHLSAAVGFRVGFVPSGSLDLFATRDAFIAPVVRFGWAPFSSGRWSLAFTPEWSFFGVGAVARGVEATLDVHRFSLGLEGRFHFDHRLYAYARLAPGLAFARAFLNEPSGAVVGDEDSTFRVDGVVGIAARLAGSSDGAKSEVRFHAYVEGGFDPHVPTDLQFTQVSDAPERIERLDWDGLDLTNGHVGAGLFLTF